MPSQRPCLDSTPCHCTQGRGGFHLSTPGKSRCTCHQPYAWPERPGMGGQWPAIRKRKLKRNPNCERCRAKAITVDHIKARARGGTDAPTNLMSLCGDCAKAKDAKNRKAGQKR